jgi:hypothetical protein
MTITITAFERSPDGGKGRHAGLLPSDPNARARAITWMFAALSTVEPPLMSPAAKRGPPTSEPSTLNWRFTPASHRPADCYVTVPLRRGWPHIPRRLVTHWPDYQAASMQKLVAGRDRPGEVAGRGTQSIDVFRWRVVVLRHDWSDQ